MKTFELKGQERKDLGKNATKALRTEGMIPASIYGGEKDGVTVHFVVNNADVRKLIYTPDVYAVILEIGKNKYTSVVQEIQFHPVTDAILHIDFLRVFDDRPMVVQLPVALEGLAAGVKAGGRLSTDLRKLKVRGLLKNMPERLTVDVTSLKLGDTIQVLDLGFEGLELLNAANAVVCRVQLTRAAKGAAAAEKSDKKDKKKGKAEEAEEEGEEVEE